MIAIREGGLGDARVEALIRHHRDEARATTPVCNAHSLDSGGLAAPDVRFFSAWEGDELAGIEGVRLRLEVPGQCRLQRERAARVEPALGIGEVAQERRGGRHRAADVARLHEAFGAEGVAVADQEVHGLGHGRAVAAVAHGFFFVGQAHAEFSRVAAGAAASAAGRR